MAKNDSAKKKEKKPRKARTKGPLAQEIDSLLIGGLKEPATRPRPTRRKPGEPVFRNYTPENLPRSVAGPSKKQEEPIVVENSESDLTDPPPTPPKPKPKKEAVEEEKDEGNVAEEGLPITYYCYVRKNESTAAAKKKNAKPFDLKEHIARTPFTDPSSTTYPGLLVKISQTLPCSVLNILNDQIYWQWKKPATAVPVLLGGEKGYQALIDDAKAVRGACQVFLFMPPPIKSARDDAFWDDGKKFDYSQLDAPTTSDSISQQRVKFDIQVKTQLEQLKEAYPINNHPLYPGKWVYVQERTGFCWDLTDKLRISNWASHLSKNDGSATLKVPPNTPYFDVGSRLKVPAASNPTPTAAPAFTPAMVAPPAAPAPSGGSSAMDVIALCLVQQMMQGPGRMMGLGAIKPGAAVDPVPAPPAPPHPARSNPASPSYRVNVDVPLEAFCKHYSVQEDDHQKLLTLGYIPGDPNILKLDTDTWHKIAGFTPLGWRRVLDSHKRFIADVKNGAWAEYTTA
ncbi:hypothetical protein V5O48_011394 [Marasmius crinis-equi]|uniref:Uncharacterized protein n=1 Tax=Marasmius crinis-equi TaxID=585013 RepID=A0ABR3F5P0_9AGAR